MTSEHGRAGGEHATLRVRLDFGYDGTDFSGWARQPGLRTVEAELSAALTTMLRAADPVRLTVAGRTDAGVHARGAVAHADIDAAAWAALPARANRDPGESAARRLRGLLPQDIVVRSVAPAPLGFDARFSATSRRYSYRLCDSATSLDPLRRRDTVLHSRPLDVAAMNAAAQRLVGLHDFAAFCKRRVGATTVRTLLHYSWSRRDDVIEATVVADAFCHSMVRALVGAVVPVGEGRCGVEWPQLVLSARRREPLAAVMPSHGLCLQEVTYPPAADLAEQAASTRARRSLPESEDHQSAVSRFTELSRTSDSDARQV